MLDFWYQAAGLFWYYYSKVFTVAFLSEVWVEPLVPRCFTFLVLPGIYGISCSFMLRIYSPKERAVGIEGFL